MLQESTPKLRDALRGAMWERKWRGTLEEFPDHYLLEERALALVKLGNRHPPDEVIPPDSSNNLPDQFSGSKAGYGTYGWKGDTRLIETCLSTSIALIDTAEGYGFGRVEKALGEVLKHGKGATWVATKVARNHMSKKATINAGRRSRHNLQIPAIDLYQIHWPPPEGNLAPCLEGLAELLFEGTILRVGVSNFCAGQLALANKLAGELGFSIFSNQIRLNLDDLAAEEYLIPFCRERGIRVIAYSSLGQGKYRGMVTKSLQRVATSADCVLFATNNRYHLGMNLKALGHKVTECA